MGHNETSTGLAVFASGAGRTLRNLLRAGSNGEIPAHVALVVTDRPQAGASAVAEEAGVPHVCLDWRGLGPAEFGRRAFAQVETRLCGLVALAGFLRLLAIPAAWTGRVLNIHPALLPAFGGPGMYGMHVHEAVLSSGATESGCTVHYADDGYDSGVVILQRRVPVLAEDTPEALAERVFRAECLAYPEAIRLHLLRRAGR